MSKKTSWPPFAKLGLSPNKMQAIYGEPFQAQGSVCIYHSQGTDIVTVYHEGKSVSCIYSHRNESLFSKREVAAAMEANIQPDTLWNFVDAGSIQIWSAKKENILVLYKPYDAPPALVIDDVRYKEEFLSPRWAEDTD